MTIDDLRNLLLAAPTAGAADSALATLLGLAGDGDAAAITALQTALAQALDEPPSRPCSRVTFWRMWPRWRPDRLRPRRQPNRPPLLTTLPRPSANSPHCNSWCAAATCCNTRP